MRTNGSRSKSRNPARRPRAISSATDSPSTPGISMRERDPTRRSLQSIRSRCCSETSARDPPPRLSPRAPARSASRWWGSPRASTSRSRPGSRCRGSVRRAARSWDRRGTCRRRSGPCFARVSCASRPSWPAACGVSSERRIDVVHRRRARRRRGQRGPAGKGFPDGGRAARAALLPAHQGLHRHVRADVHVSHVRQRDEGIRKGLPQEAGPAPLAVRRRAAHRARRKEPLELEPRGQGSPGEARVRTRRGTGGIRLPLRTGEAARPLRRPRGAASARAAGRRGDRADAEEAKPRRAEASLHRRRQGASAGDGAHQWTGRREPARLPRHEGQLEPSGFLVPLRAAEGRPRAGDQMKRIVLFALLLAACGGPSRTVMVNGREVSVDDAATDVLRRAKQAQDAGRNEDALKGYRQILERYGDSSAADEARFREGQTLSRMGKLQDAQAKLSELLEKHPNTAFKKDAALELSAVQTKLGNPQAAAEAMKIAISQMSDAEKLQAAGKIAETYTKTGDSAEAARFAARALEAAQSPDQRTARMTDYLNALYAAPGSAVAQLVAEL